MAARHFEIASRELSRRRYPKNIVQATRAVLVDGVEAAQASIEFRVPAPDLLLALEDHSAAWAKYCADNALIHNGIWLPNDMLPRAKAIETRAINRAERRLKEKELESRQRKSLA
jgi:hypothetical protein